eukprot:2146243-Prymnesium_polylepis.1
MVEEGVEVAREAGLVAADRELAAGGGGGHDGVWGVHRARPRVHMRTLQPAAHLTPHTRTSHVT